MINDPHANQKTSNLMQLHLWYTSKLATQVRETILPDLQARLVVESDPELRMTLYSYILVEHTRNSKPEEALSIAKRQVDEFPAQPLSWITLSEVYSHQLGNFKLALDAINSAIKAARLTGTFRRQSLQTKARILRDIEDFLELEKCLKEIIHEPTSIGIDVAKEDDFLTDLPPGVISPEVELSYRTYMRSP